MPGPSPMLSSFLCINKWESGDKVGFYMYINIMLGDERSGILACQPIYETKHAGERDYATRDNYR